MGLLPDEAPDSEFILTKLRDKKLVKSRAFSMGLRDKGQGALTFGGYDTSKFSGPLETIPLKRKPANGNRQYIVEMQSLSLGKDNGSNQTISDKQSLKRRQMTIGLDSGSPALVISTTVAQDLQKTLGGSFEKNWLHVNCSIVDTQAALNFDMSNQTTVSVPLQDFVSSRKDGGKTCTLAIKLSYNVPARKEHRPIGIATLSDK
ncbi:hypothetical protein QQS21_007441 [Conoideocrella luteorostrata]|uniref:Peptidase A1 domain-containing protein n=1 Tax=Conoideocrella luteorostrata TaxID=1105319 RepID=A0AAJ0FXD6_9HYPO|nr:hypothetical protein QQS21_007441 [Conoideocrella luteorostrata]